MTARDKLNVAHLHGCLLIAGSAGLLSGSWFWGLIVLLGLIVLALAADDLRLQPRSGRR